MNSIRKEIALYIQIGTVVIIWIILIFIHGLALNINWKTIILIPEVVGVYAIGRLIFINWLWRIKVLQGWLIKIPYLQGTWKGHLISTWIDPQTEERMEPIGFYLVIRQTFYRVNITTFTKESIGHSNSASINIDEERGLFQLSFNYTNTPKAAIRERSQVHEGAAILRLSFSRQAKLEGEFWTNRKTTGEISLKYSSKKLLEYFPDE